MFRIDNRDLSPDERLDWIEEYLSNRQGISLKDLPMQALRDSLEQDWNPSADTLVLPKSITTESLAQVPTVGVKIIAPDPASSVPTASETAISWGSVEWDTSDSQGMWSAAAATKLVAPIDGIYTASGYVVYPENHTGDRFVGIRPNGGPTLGWNGGPTPATAGQNHPLTATTVVKLFKGQYVEIVGYQNSGSSLSVIPARASLTFLSNLYDT